MMFCWDLTTTTEGAEAKVYLQKLSHQKSSDSEAAAFSLALAKSMAKKFFQGNYSLGLVAMKI